MRIAGLQKTTLLDYPGCVAATIFTYGCNFRCPFCHNMNLVDIKYADSVENINEQDIIDFLKKRVGILDAVCITGGEPTLQVDLEEFIRIVKSMGYKVKLDTNGTNPDLLEKLLENRLLDYVAMDIKSSFSSYDRAVGVCVDIEKIRKSIDILNSSDIDYEFRTTIVSGIHTRQDILEIADIIKGAKKYYLQSFVDSEYVENHELKEEEYKTLLEYKDIVGVNVGQVEIRGRAE